VTLRDADGLVATGGPGSLRQHGRIPAKLPDISPESLYWILTVVAVDQSGRGNSPTPLGGSHAPTSL
jgi:hypothetical protein